MQAIYVDPYDLSAHELLQDIYQGSGNAEGLAREGAGDPDPAAVDRGAEEGEQPGREVGECKRMIPLASSEEASETATALCGTEDTDLPRLPRRSIATVLPNLPQSVRIK